MATTSPNTTPNSHPQDLMASIDMGSNSLKLLIVRTHPRSGKFLTVEHIKEPVVLGRDTATSTISTDSQLRALQALHRFKEELRTRKIGNTRVVATAAVREAANRAEFIRRIREEVGFEVEILSGEEEARLVYLGVLQSIPAFDKLVLNVDIGGGSTEFVIGRRGNVVYAKSLKLGHVSLSEEFLKFGHESSSKGAMAHDAESLNFGHISKTEKCDGIERMRQHIRGVIRVFGLIEKVKEIGFEMAVGSSGTILAIERAVFMRYAEGAVDDDGMLRWDFGRDWRFSRGELRSLVRSLCDGGRKEKLRREKFFKRRSEFIVAGAVLLEEICGMLGIEEIEVSGYALGEGVIAESFATQCNDRDASARWLSVVRLATRFNTRKRMNSAVCCACVAKEIFEGLKAYDMLANNENELVVSLDDEDVEYLEAACLLHNVGLYTGKKGYHKQSYHIIMNGDHLLGYTTDEVKLIALLARHHRKKFPKLDHDSLEGFSEKVRQKFRVLCVIIRLSLIVLLHYQCVNLQDVKFSFSQEGFRLVFREAKDDPSAQTIEQPLAYEIQEEIRQEVEHFRTVFQRGFSIMVPSTTLKSPQR